MLVAKRQSTLSITIAVWEIDEYEADKLECKYDTLVMVSWINL